ncbi:MAG TPA: bifunctional serine/threonine-protein kinase/formylglycine-generating enzyme family protein [Pyrinomonadaceae bacterium]|nr:bifunctional serine/threonine-protein kinase/formylglycine-generating enzyme family protein [Pyrinomonadaceae bacterium]
MRECQVCKQCYPDAVATCPKDNQPTFQSIEGNPILEGKYRLEKRLGQGGMGVVYSAKHTYLKTQLAIKVILPDLVGNDPQLVTRFRQEALAAAAIRHHNVVQVTDYGVANETMPFLVMEYVEGESLHDMLAREKTLSPEKAVELMAAICAGVGAAHKQGIVHRDLKPLNVMILKDSQSLAEGVKILDFGLAKIKSGELLGSFVQAQTTGLMGSPYYMAPEQWADEDLEPQADIYSLGVMLYQMLAGDVPFKGSSIPAIMQKHLNNPPPTFKEMGVDVPVQIEGAVRHALEKDRTKRPQDVHEFVQELRRALGLSTQALQMPTGALPASSIHVLTQPPQARVFLDNIPIGESQTDGYLLLEGIQSGNHRVKVSKEGFHDWENQIFCDGKPQQVVAQLQHSSGNINAAATVQMNQSQMNQSLGYAQGNQTQGMQSGFQQTGQTPPPNLYQNSGQASQSGMQGQSQQNWQPSGSQIYVENTPKKSSFSPLVLAVIGIFGLLLLTVIGVGGSYMLGLIGTNPTITPTSTNTTQPPASPTPPITEAKNEMVSIPGGKFKMGNNQGTDREQPEHEVEVKPFKMSKFEISNAEYAQFVADANYKAPEHFVDGKPRAGEENLPVSRVSLDDAKAYAEWRSKKENIQYRIPTEIEWEYAARNGNANNLYPWGDKWEENRAILNATSLKPVGSAKSGADEWGVQDLIGNISEWTDTEFQAYENGEFKAPTDAKGTFVTRGGSYAISSGSKITSATRYYAPPSAKDARLGFRLVSSN